MTTLDQEAQRRRRVQGGVALAVVLLLALAVWWLSKQNAGIKREVAAPPTIILTPPPPPPPPPLPPKETPPEPDKVQPVSTPQPTPSPAPKAPSPSQPQQLTMNGPAQAGSDAFGVQAGSGGGMAVVGGAGPGGPGGGDNGFAEANYNRYLSSLIQQAVQGDEHVNRQVFTVDMAVWMNGQGKITRARILKTGGNAKIDKALMAILESMSRFEEPPPATLKFPQRVTIRGRRT